jgi:hypothetical protein
LGALTDLELGWFSYFCRGDRYLFSLKLFRAGDRFYKFQLIKIQKII